MNIVEEKDSELVHALNYIYVLHEERFPSLKLRITAVRNGNDWVSMYLVVELPGDGQYFPQQGVYKFPALHEPSIIKCETIDSGALVVVRYTNKRGVQEKEIEVYSDKIATNMPHEEIGNHLYFHHVIANMEIIEPWITDERVVRIQVFPERCIVDGE